MRAALAGGEFEELGGGRFRVLGHELEPDDVIVERAGKEGWAVEAQDGVTVALDTALDDDLAAKGRVNELVHQVNTMRKEAGLELTDRIVLTIPEADAELSRTRTGSRPRRWPSTSACGGELAIAKA